MTRTLLVLVAAGVMVGCAGGTSAGEPPGGRALVPAQGAARAPGLVAPVGLGPTCPATGTTGPHHLEIIGFAYCPATPEVAVGTEVVWSNSDQAPHTVTYHGPDGPVDSGSMAQGQSWSNRFAHAGTYRYYCRFHPGMEGTIVVVPGP